MADSTQNSQRRRWPPPRISSLEISDRKQNDLPQPKKFMQLVLRTISVLCWSKAVLIAAGMVLYLLLLIFRHILFSLSSHYDIDLEIPL
jgi:hypothetical protein